MHGVIIQVLGESIMTGIYIGLAGTERNSSESYSFEPTDFTLYRHYISLMNNNNNNNSNNFIFYRAKIVLLYLSARYKIMEKLLVKIHTK